MNESIPSFLKLKDKTVYFNGTGEFLFFVPEVYFSQKHAIVEGEFINLIGILNYSIIQKEGDDITKNLKFFRFPTVFLTRPGRIEKVKKLRIASRDPEDYRVLHYRDNGVDQIVASFVVPQEIVNVEEFMQIFVKTGKIPANIPYDILHELFLENMELNGSSYKITAQEFGIIVSELCRDPKDLSTPYRLSKSIDKSQLDYAPISIKAISKIVSPFTSITTENWDEAVVSASIIEPDNIKDTPMERILTGKS